MGNEFTAGDLTPHLIARMVFEKKIDVSATAGTKTVVIAGGYHPKMRLRYAHQMVVDAAVSGADGAFNVLHGSNEVVAAAPLTDGDAIGVLDELSIVDQYKDVAASEQIALEVDHVPGVSGTVLVHLEYELVE